jgi:hypothetical protein
MSQPYAHTSTPFAPSFLHLPPPSLPPTPLLPPHLSSPPTRYTWEIYAKRLLTLASVYGFWKRVSNLERAETKRYLEMLYALKLRSLIERVPLTKDEEELPLTPKSPQPRHFF